MWFEIVRISTDWRLFSEEKLEEDNEPGQSVIPSHFFLSGIQNAEVLP